MTFFDFNTELNVNTDLHFANSTLEGSPVIHGFLQLLDTRNTSKVLDHTVGVKATFLDTLL